MSTGARIHATVTRVDDLPTLPDIYTDVAEVVDAEGSAQHLERIIVRDPALTSKLLRMANSAFFGMSGEITTVAHAVSVLGFQTLKQVVLTTSVLDAFDRIEGGIDPREAWEHSLATAVAAKQVAQRVKLQKSAEYFVAGLLHDIGVLVEMKYHPEEFKDVLRLRAEQGLSLSDAERRVLGQGHETTGYELCRRWKLPMHLATVVAYHHGSDYSLTYRRETASIAVAECVAETLGYRELGSTDRGSFSDSALACLELSTSDVDAVVEEVELAMRDASDVLGR